MATQAGKQVWTDVDVPQTKVTVYEALHNRRMAWKFEDKPVPREAVERMLGTAIWAPNHRNNEPWRFYVIDKDSDVRKQIGDAVYAGLMEEWNDERRSAPYRDKILDPPVLVYVYYLANDDWFVDKENYAAVIAALQNVSLAGVAEGVSVTWDTGRVTRIPAVDQVLGVGPELKVMTVLSIGYPDEESQASRTPAAEFVHWV